MAKFAKLFDLADEEQVLVTVGTNDDGDWQVKFATEIEGVRCYAAPTFTRKDPAGPGDPERGARRFFESVDMGMAERVRASLLDAVADGEEDDEDGEP